MTRVRRLEGLKQGNRMRATRARPRTGLHGVDGPKLRARRPARRRREGWAVRLARLAFVVALGVFGYGLWSQPVRSIEFDGVLLSDEDTLRARAEALTGQRWVTLDTEEVAASITGMSWVRSVRFSRELPDAVRVEVREVRPVARVQREDAWWAVGEDGRAAPLPAGVLAEGLPVVDGLFDDDGGVDPEAAGRLRALVDALREGGWPFGAGLEHIDLDLPSGLSLRTGDDIEIRLGARDTARQIRTAALAWSHLAPAPGDRLDLRFSRQAVLTRAGG